MSSIAENAATPEGATASDAVVATIRPRNGAIIAPADPLAHARSMSAEQLGEHIRKEWKPLCTKLASLRPYIEAAFEKMAAGEAVCGYTSKKKFCPKVLGRSYNAVKAMLGGGNPRKCKRDGGGRPKHLTELEHRLLGTAAAVHEALAAIRAGRIEDAVQTLSKNAPAQDRIEEYLERGTKPSMTNPEDRAGLRRHDSSPTEFAAMKAAPAAIKLARAVIEQGYESKFPVARAVLNDLDPKAKVASLAPEPPFRKGDSASLLRVFGPYFDQVFGELEARASRDELRRFFQGICNRCSDALIVKVEINDDLPAGTDESANAPEPQQSAEPCQEQRWLP